MVSVPDSAKSAPQIDSCEFCSCEDGRPGELPLGAPGETVTSDDILVRR